MRIPQDTPSPAPTDGLPQVSPQLQTAPVERPRPAAAFPESDLLYQSLFEHMLEGLAYCQMLYDRQERPRDFVYLAVNGAFERLTGLKNVVGRPVSRVIPGIQQITPELFEIYGRVAATGQPERFEVDFKPLGLWLSISVFSLALANQHIATAMAKASPRFEWMHQRADTGETFPAEVLLSAMKLDGKSVLQAVVRNITDRKKAEAQREFLVRNLEEALAQVKSLSGLRPICSGCKKIRDGQGQWSQVESYVQKHSDATFTHGLCPDCLKNPRAKPVRF